MDVMLLHGYEEFVLDSAELSEKSKMNLFSQTVVCLVVITALACKYSIYDLCFAGNNNNQQ